MEFKFINAISTIDAKQWDQLWQTPYPFIQHAFLAALESSGSTSKHTGWQPYHATVWQNQQLIAAAPLYIKTHSYGEYVFDWAWADAYHQAGFEYYPKWLNAIPFTPSTGPRCTTKNAEATAYLWAQILSQAESQKISGVHCLFSNASVHPAIFKQRLGCQFHWFNQGYPSFENFTHTLQSRKRKNIIKERNKISAQNIEVNQYYGHSLTQQHIERFIQFYQSTYLQKSGHHGYLEPEFFYTIFKHMANNLLIIEASVHQTPVAQALYFYDDNTLYGRYWGTNNHYDCLHYELCYYQGIEFAIKNQLQRFDAGAQGEHKVARGFTPVLTQSHHWIRHPQFANAIDGFLHQEHQHIHHYCTEARTGLPFKAGVTQPEPTTLITPCR